MLGSGKPAVNYICLASVYSESSSAGAMAGHQCNVRPPLRKWTCSSNIAGPTHGSTKTVV